MGAKRSEILGIHILIKNIYFEAWLNICNNCTPFEIYIIDTKRYSHWFCIKGAKPRTSDSLVKVNSTYMKHKV